MNCRFSTGICFSADVCIILKAVVPALRTLMALSLAPLILAAKKPPVSNPSQKTISWHCFRHENPWSGLTDSAEAETKTRHIRALKLPADKFNRIKPIEGILSADEYILMRLPESREVTVNAVYFSDLNRPDVTRTLAPQPYRIGTATPVAMKRFSPLQLLTILIQYQVIQTYIHVESTVLLARETRTGDRWLADLRGQHIYYTNEKNTKDFAFRFSLDLKTGEMLILPPVR